MAEVIGKVTNIKVASYLQDSVNSFDTASITLVENVPPHNSWLFYLWNSKDTDPAVRRVLHSQRLALVREAAFRKLNVHIVHQNNSSIADSITVDIP